MRGLRRRKSGSMDEIDVDMVPIMNMFLVLVPFLLMSASFLHIKAINTSVPVLSETTNNVSNEENLKVTVIAELKKNGIGLSLNSDSVKSSEINKWTTTIPAGGDSEYPFGRFSNYLEKLKADYPASDTLIIIPDNEVIYDTIIHIMDVARHTQEDIKLFPNVVISGKIT